MNQKLEAGEWSKVLTPIQTTLSLSDRVYNILLEAILSHQIQPGQHLVEQPLADQLSVSRISIREAIRRLAQDGLVKIIPSRGAFVVALTLADVDEIYRVRIALESIALEKVMQEYQPGQLDAFTGTLTAMEAIANDNDRLQAARLDNQFHRTLVQLSGLTRTLQMWEQISSQIMLVIYTVSQTYPHIDGLNQRHAPFLQLIRARQFPPAQQFLQEHIQEGAQNILAAMNKI